MNHDRQETINAFIRKDAFAERLGVEFEAISLGYSRVSVTVTNDMMNFHGTTHGGLVFALGDVAFSAASNSRGQTAVALNVSITYLRASKAGDVLVAEAKETQANGPIALYDIAITDRQTGEMVAKSQNLVYRRKEWFAPE
jgi:acyl-CoA thioesterase